MRQRKDRRTAEDANARPNEGNYPAARERRKLPDRRLENLNAEQRQLLLSEMPGYPVEKLSPKK